MIFKKCSRILYIIHSTLPLFSLAFKGITKFRISTGKWWSFVYFIEGIKNKIHDYYKRWITLYQYYLLSLYKNFFSIAGNVLKFVSSI